MLPKEVPVEGVEGASLGALTLFGVELAGGTVVAHFILISGACGVRFGGEEAPIGKEDHAEDVGHHDPVVGIEIHFTVPAKNCLGLVSAKEEKVAEDHQSLNMVVVGVIDCAMDGLGYAAHLGLARIGPPWQRAIGPKEVDLTILRHFQPVDSVNELPPAEDLSNKTLHRVERGFTVAVGFFGCLDAFERSE